MSILKIVATIDIKAEFEKDLESILHTIVDETRKEEGNISYDLHQDIKNPLRYIILEVWKDQTAIDTHNASAHFQSFVSAIEGKIEKLSADVIKQVY